LRAHRVGLSLFFCLWVIYGAVVNSRNQYEFNLQQAGVEAVVERHHFYLEGSSTPRFQMQVYYYDGGKPFGDVFSHNGHQYAAKQPGQFMAGALAWFFLRLLGLDYQHHYTLTSALVSWLTTSLVTALAAVAVFAMVRELTSGRLFWPLTCALIYCLGTTAFVYSGIAYHDLRWRRAIWRLRFLRRADCARSGHRPVWQPARGELWVAVGLNGRRRCCHFLWRASSGFMSSGCGNGN
jgi:hypothetical protein